MFIKSPTFNIILTSFFVTFVFGFRIHTLTAYPETSRSINEDDYTEPDLQQRVEINTRQPIAFHREFQNAQVVNATQRERSRCLEPKEVGRCKLFLPRYFFNSETGLCERFTFGGCGGNGNNFMRLTTCESHCSAHGTLVTEAPVDSIVPNTNGVCELAPTTGQNCKAYLPRWTYNKQEGRCVQFIYTGCGATANMYRQKHDCELQCENYQPTRNQSEVPITTLVSTSSEPRLRQNSSSIALPRVCDEPLQLGSCFEMSHRYYFNSGMNRCLSFTFNGCGGNENNFRRGEDCLRMCGGSTPAENVACARVSCPMNLYTHYAALGCTPVYDGDACCPTRYDCHTKPGNDSSSSSTTPMCSYKGKLYRVGQEIPEGSTASSCRAACRCWLSSGNKASINCASIECPESLGIKPPGKENCTALYRLGECCAFDFFCRRNETNTLDERDAMWVLEPERDYQHTTLTQRTEPQPITCHYEGKQYVAGEKIEPREDTCRTCICQRGFNGTLNSDFCEPIDCGIEIYYAPQLERGCAPVYYQDAENRIRCCPIGWECPDDYFATVEPTTTRPGVTTTPTLQRVQLPLPELPSFETGVVTTEACALPMLTGSCKGRRPRFYYNARTFRCDPFVYGGCGGNDNNFVVLEDCVRVCGNLTDGWQNLVSSQRSAMSRPKVPSHPIAYELSETDECTQPRKLGSCRGYFRRYYYAPELDQCRSFVYSGCGGNKNNFRTLDTCAAKCQNRFGPEDFPINDTASYVQSTLGLNTSHVNSTQPQSVSWETTSVQRNNTVKQFFTENPCNLPPASGPCAASLHRWYYDAAFVTCNPFLYGGCGGNSNNFQDLRDCEIKCKPRRTTVENQDQLVLDPKWRTALGIPTPQIPQRRPALGSDRFERCSLPKNPGPCRAFETNYYFDVESRSCDSFRYGGCFGNANRFLSLTECQSNCAQLNNTNDNRPTARRVLHHHHSHITSANHTQPQQSSRTNGTCSMPVAPGDCRSYTLRFHWNPTTKECAPFVYSGCRGNENNFLSEADCILACAQEPPIEILAQEGALTCSFGNETYSIGTSLGEASTGTGNCGRPVCTCTTPPSLTCIQKQCPQPPFMVSQATSYQPTTAQISNSTQPPCPHVRCPPDCKPNVGIGEDGCLTCDCSNGTSRTYLTPSVQTLCPPVTCRPGCRYRLNENGCGSCDCLGTTPTDVPCPTVTCRPSCRSRVGSDGCVRCDCSRMVFTAFAVPQTHSERKQTGGCQALNCASDCSLSIDATGCVACDCNNSEHVQELI